MSLARGTGLARSQTGQRDGFLPAFRRLVRCASVKFLFEPLRATDPSSTLPRWMTMMTTLSKNHYRPMLAEAAQAVTAAHRQVSIDDTRRLGPDQTLAERCAR
jgi:hypothetical protein